MAEDKTQPPNPHGQVQPPPGSRSDWRETGSGGLPDAGGDNRRSGPASLPLEDEIFGAPFARKPPHSDIFGSLLPGTGPRAHLRKTQSVATTARRFFTSLRHLSRVQKLLLVAIVMVAIAVLYAQMGRTVPAPQPDPMPVAQSPFGGSPSPQQARMGFSVQETAVPPSRPAPVDRAQASLSETLPSMKGRLWEPGDRGEEPPLTTQTVPGLAPLSLQLADKLYLHREFEPALAMYDKLAQRLPATEENQPVRDFLFLRMALCNKNSGNTAQADTMLRTVSLSRLPILRALARYHQACTLVSRKRYLEAAAKAYQTAALIEVADYDKKWVSAVQRQCESLSAEAMTRHLLVLCDADANLPRELWSEHPDIDPFVDMDEPRLRVFLTSGAERLDETVLSPQIRNAGDQGGVRRWSVICNGAPIEELLARFAANAGLNIRWPDDRQAAPTDDTMRVRPVYLYLPSATALQVVTTAAGGVGLIAQLDDRGNLRLLDPTSYSSLADHTQLLADEAIALWQRFLLTSENDPQAGNAHFAIALLQATRGQFAEALAEYKLVANRFAKHVLAPHALLQSGLLKVRLRDYAGAHEDLKRLVELYPENELSDRACLYLADAAMKAGLYQEATGLYRKVYNLGLSVESQTRSALGAGRCLYESKQYEEAAQWLSRYTVLARDQSGSTFSVACLLLGKAYLALHQPQRAQVALNLAIKGELSRQQHVETFVVLAKTYMERGFFLETLNVLEGTDGWQLSQQEAVELALLRGQALRSIGLADRAISLLAEKSQYLASPELQAQIALELARCYQANGDLEAARKMLSEAFMTTEPGSQADRIGRELAGVCLRLGQTGQALSVCLRLLENASASEKPLIQALLADVYRKQGKYSEAVAALLAEYEVPELVKDN